MITQICEECMSSCSKLKDASWVINYAKLFIEPPNKNYGLLKIDKESVSYITTPHNGAIICEIIKSNIDSSQKNITIFDGTAGVGGDTIIFGHNFKKVISCEINKNRFNMLKNNMRVYSLTNVITHNESFLDIIYDIDEQIDIIYLDPPWGGKNYKNIHDIRIKLNNKGTEKDIEDIILDFLDPKLTNISNTLKMIVLKLPNNYDIQYMHDKIKTKSTIKTQMLLYELQKMKIIVINLIKS